MSSEIVFLVLAPLQYDTRVASTNSQTAISSFNAQHCGISILVRLRNEQPQGRNSSCLAIPRFSNAVLVQGTALLVPDWIQGMKD
jgi:hypothetical protein